MEQLRAKLEQIAEHLQNEIEASRAREKALEERQQEKIRTLYNLAHYDVLTSIPNRLFFDQALDRAMLQAEENESSLALYFIDLDDFKHINDSYGHKAGDYALVTVAKRIKENIRHSDILARIGGDEFALIVENYIGEECLVQLAEKIIQVFSEPLYFNDQKIALSCSIGISRYRKDTCSKEELIDFADIAMYHTKAIGKSHYAFYEHSLVERSTL
jgi:diguanylate cyclase (GGDEF)-like protein